jgi:hypothetical protein
MENKTALESKKFLSMVVGVLACLAAGTAAGFAGPVGVTVLPYVIGGITAICGVQIGGQAVVDYKNEKNGKVKPE